MGNDVNVIPEGYGWPVVGVVILCLALISCRSPSLLANIKKGVILLLVAGGIALGYYFLTGRSLSEIPAEVDHFFNKPREAEPTSHKYYINPEKRYKELKE